MSGQVISAVNLTNGNKHSIGLPYGVCSTAKDTAAKTVTVNGGDGFVLEAGAMVIVKFTNANSIASPTLNVNGTGAKSICRYGTTKVNTGTTTTGWVAGAVQTFVYDGTNWIREYWNNTTYSNASLGQGYAEQDNTAQAAAITATLGSYSLTAGGVVAFKANYNVLANSTLNINGKGAKPIWFRGLAIANNIIKAGDVATLIYDGANYHLLAVDRWQNDIEDLKDYADNAANAVKNDLLNGAGAAYDTLKELGDLIDDNKDAIDALETVAGNKADSSHTHNISDVTNLQPTLDEISEKANESDVLVVKIGGSEANGYTVDKTFEQIKEAYDNNKYVFAHHTSGIRLDLTRVNASKAWFSGATLSGLMDYSLIITSENVVNFTSSSKSATQYLFGGVKAATKSDTDTVEAKIGTDGKLYVPTYPSLDNYYTESEVDTKLSGKANTSHGNHVPATETANNAKFLRNDNTWQTVTPANIGASDTGHKHAATDITSGTLSSDRLPTVPVAKGGTGSTTAAGALTNLGLTATAAELNYCDGATSNIQAQLNTKLASVDASSTYMTKSNPTGEGTLTMTGNGEFSGSVSVESLQVGGVTLNYDNTNKFLEFVFTSTTDTGTEG